MTSTIHPGRRLRELMSGEKMVVAPGAYDAITATLINRAGFDALYMTGAGTSASLGFPDYGLLTMSEMVANAGRMTASVNIPLIADADTGYGNELNVTRTVHEYERHGAAGIHIEDQGFPKRCGHLDNKEIIPAEDFVAKIRAACDARRSKDFVIIARTDARAMAGLDEAISRANAAIEAGADVAFVEAAQTMEEVEAIPKRVQGPCLLNIVHRGKTPPVTLDAATAMGYKIAILPTLLFRHVLGCCEDVLDAVKSGTIPAPIGDISPAEAFSRFGADDWDELRTKFRDTEKNTASAGRTQAAE